MKSLLSMLLAAACIAILAMAGCVSDARGSDGLASSTGTSSSAPEPDPAPEPQANETSTAIAGTVVDEEAMPVSRASVTLVEPAITTVTDAAGRFTFNDLQPGTYTVLVERTGYEGTGVRIEATLGQVAQLEIVISLIPIPQTAYHVSESRVAHIVAGNAGLTTIWYQGVNQSAYNSLVCDPCRFGIYIQPGPADILSEPIWTSPVNAPAVNERVFLDYLADGPPEESANHVWFGYFTNAQGIHFPDSALDVTKDQTKIRLWVRPDLTGVSVDHRVEIWTTFGYHAVLPDAFSALPPE